MSGPPSPSGGRAACALFRRQDFFPRRAKSRCRSGRLGSTVSARSGGFFSQQAAGYAGPCMIEPFEPARTRFAAMSAEEAVDAAGAVFRKLDLL